MYQQRQFFRVCKNWQIHQSQTLGNCGHGRRNQVGQRSLHIASRSDASLSSCSSAATAEDCPEWLVDRKVQPTMRAILGVFTSRVAKRHSSPPHGRLTKGRYPTQAWSAFFLLLRVRFNALSLNPDRNCTVSKAAFLVLPL